MPVPAPPPVPGHVNGFTLRVLDDGRANFGGQHLEKAV